MRQSVQYIRLNAERFGVDSTHLGAFGSSAGGHLSLLLGSASVNGNPEQTDEMFQHSSQADAVVAIAAPSDLRGWVTGPPEQVKTITTEKTWRLYDAETAPECPPLLHATARTAPTLFIHGKNDELVTIDHSHLMFEELNKHNVTSSLLVVEGCSHVFDQIQNQELVMPAVWLIGSISSWQKRSDTQARDHDVCETRVA